MELMVVTQLRYYTYACLEGLTEVKNSQGSRCSGQDRISYRPNPAGLLLERP